VVSSNSIQWEFDFKRPDIVQQSTESYKDDFTEEEGIKQSPEKAAASPRGSSSDGSDSEEELLAMADAFTEEYIAIMVKDMEEAGDYRVGEVLDEELFNNKFPFNQREPEPIEEPKVVISPKPPVVKLPS
jgi:hypothetical protein